jgi:hypothetical protein
MEVKILNKKLVGREDSFWYHGQEIAKYEFPNGKKLYAEARGEIRVFFEEDGPVFKGANAVDEALEQGLTDKDLDKIHDHDGWGLNNWFAIVMVDIDGNTISDDLCIAGDYDEVIDQLEKLGPEEYKKLYS